MLDEVGLKKVNEGGFMEIVLVGAGKLAKNLGLALFQAGHRIQQVYSRTNESAEALANILNAQSVSSFEKIDRQADAYIIALTDAALADAVPTIVEGREEGVFLHTSGSMPMSVFEGGATGNMTGNTTGDMTSDTTGGANGGATPLHYGVLYPLQSFSKERRVDFREIPFFIEGADEKALSVARMLAESLSTTVQMLSSEDRRKVHLAAVFANNFANHCFTVAADILEKYNLPFSHIAPLIAETANKIGTIHPKDAQTGPALRYDENVIKKHLDMLADNPDAQEIYDIMSRSIHNRHSK